MNIVLMKTTEKTSKDGVRCYYRLRNSEGNSITESPVVIFKEKGVKGDGRFVIEEWPDEMPRLTETTSVMLHKAKSWPAVASFLRYVTGNTVQGI